MHLFSLFSGKYLVIVKVVGQTSYKQFVRRIRNDCGDDTYRHQQQQQDQTFKTSSGSHRRTILSSAVFSREQTWDVESRLLRDSRQRPIIVRSSYLQRLTLENDPVEGHGLRRLIDRPKLEGGNRDETQHQLAFYCLTFFVLL